MPHVSQRTASFFHAPQTIRTYNLGIMTTESINALTERNSHNLRCGAVGKRLPRKASLAVVGLQMFLYFSLAAQSTQLAGKKHAASVFARALHIRDS